MKPELSFTEENYLKAIYHLSDAGKVEVSTTALAAAMDTKPATANDMIKRLSGKKLVSYRKYKGVNISTTGQQEAINIVRKHRLWEVFLFDKLDFNWDEVHDIAEQLEHIKSPVLVEKLDAFLGHPRVDPHGDPIPDKNGEFQTSEPIPLTDLDARDEAVLVGVGSDDPALLQYLDRLQLGLGKRITILEIVPFDGSMNIKILQGKSIFISARVAEKLLVRKIV